MAAGGSNVRLSLVGLTGTTAEIMYTIDTTGRYEDGYLIVFNENNTEVSRTSSFRAYGNSSGSQNVTGIESGHLYTVKFYSSDLGVYSESTVEIDLRSGTPAYAISSSSTATSVNIIVSPISSATMGKDGTVIVESASDGIKESIGYKSSDSSTSITLVGLDQNTEYTFSVTYYDPGLASSVTNTITISTSELDDKQAPKLYGGVSGDAEKITKLYGSVSGDSTKITKLYGGSDDYVFNNLQLKGNTTQQTYSGKNLFDVNNKNEFGGYFEGAQATSTLTSGVTGRNRVFWISCNANTAYSFSVSSLDDFNSPQIGTTTETPAAGVTVTGLGSFSTGTVKKENVTTGAGAKFLLIRFQTRNSSIDIASALSNVLAGLQIESGSTATSYEPYVGGTASPNPNYPQTVNVVTGEQTITVSDGNNNSDTYTVDLGSTELCKIGTYQDKIYKNGGNWYVHKETGKVVFDGSESWTRSTYSSTNNFYTPVADALKDASFINIRSDMFSPTPLSWGSLSNEVYGIALYNITSQIRILYPQSLISDANAFKTWLSTHNTTVYYALETPTDTQITNANLIAELEAIRKGAYGDDTQIVVNGNLPAIVAYDSIDETAKLIHISRPNKKVYGSITYYTDSNHTMTDIEFIYDQTDVSKLVGNGQLTWSATINGKTINNLDIKEVDISGCTSLTTTPVNFLQHCRNLDSISIPSSLISIGSGFLSYCASFNQQIILHTGISSIGDAFLFCCEAFNQPIVFPNTLTSIGITFLGGCIAFNQDLTIPSSVITIGQNFMAVCDSMIKTITCNAPSPRVGSSENINLSGSSVNAQCYVSGIKLSGPYASSWHSENPDSSSGPYYRKTIVV